MGLIYHDILHLLPYRHFRTFFRGWYLPGRIYLHQFCFIEIRSVGRIHHFHRIRRQKHCQPRRITNNTFYDAPFSDYLLPGGLMHTMIIIYQHFSAEMKTNWISRKFPDFLEFIFYFLELCIELVCSNSCYIWKRDDWKRDENKRSKTNYFLESLKNLEQFEEKKKKKKLKTKFDEQSF